MIADSVKNEYRDSTTRDLYDLARIADNCEHIHMFQRMRAARSRQHLRDGSQYDLLLRSRYAQARGGELSNCDHLGKRWRCASSPVARPLGAQDRLSAIRIASLCRR